MIRLRYGQIKIGTMSASAKASVGNNFMFGHVDSKKVSDGFGSIKGQRNDFAHNTQMIVDPDFRDSDRMHNESNEEG